MSTITKGADTITPELVLRVDAAASVSPYVHELVGGGTAYSLRAPGRRTGTLRLLFPTLADAWECWQLHLEVGVFTFTDSEHPDRSMTYLVDGKTEPALDPETRERAFVDVDYSEVIS